MKLKNNIIPYNQSLLELGQFKIDVDKRLLYLNTEIKKITTKERDLLILFINNKNILLSRKFITETIFGENNYYNARSMDILIYKVRKLLKDDSKILIINQREKEKGYKMIIEDKSNSEILLPINN